ncbi:hypothetical protein ULG90_09220 [Halopseudomonas pachastrellae]|nr:hypothetical protein ULG90_09220 [Halopseudomonas pachastrellae]
MISTTSKPATDPGQPPGRSQLCRPVLSPSQPLIDACLATGCHYLDITGEIDAFVAAQARQTDAEQANIVICPGVGFDVIPTDCIAARLKQELPDADRLALGFDSRSALSPGTAKTSVEGLKYGGRIRKDDRIVSVPLAYQSRDIDLVTAPSGDHSLGRYRYRLVLHRHRPY